MINGGYPETPDGWIERQDDWYDHISVEEQGELSESWQEIPSEKSAEQIVTRFINPPIPVRYFDWCAYLDGHEEGPYGHGETETSAIADLQEKLD